MFSLDWRWSPPRKAGQKMGSRPWRDSAFERIRPFPLGVWVPRTQGQNSLCNFEKARNHSRVVPRPNNVSFLRLVSSHSLRGFHIIHWLSGELLDYQTTIHNKFQASSDSDEESRNDSMPLVDVRMIDFAHVFAGDGVADENYLFGLNNLISSFQSLWYTPFSSFQENAPKNSSHL